VSIRIELNRIAQHTPAQIVVVVGLDKVNWKNKLLIIINQNAPPYRIYGKAISMSISILLLLLQ
jgi:hypothetical protein